MEAGEQAGILETILDRLAKYQENMMSIRSKIKSAMTYPIAVLVVAFVVTAVIMGPVALGSPPSTYIAAPLLGGGGYRAEPPAPGRRAVLGQQRP